MRGLYNLFGGAHYDNGTYLWFWSIFWRWWVNSAFGEMREILSSMKIRFPLSNVLVNKKSGDLIMKKIHKFMGRGIIDENYRKKD